ncbi:hypothetical protein V6S06_05235 [Aeromonas hydrophila]|nr:hypothetical protein [Aeromonas hydrophila]
MKLQGMTLGLSKNGPRANLDTSQRLTLGLEKNGLGAKISTQRLTRGLVGIADSAKQTT